MCIRPKKLKVFVDDVTACHGMEKQGVGRYCRDSVEVNKKRYVLVNTLKLSLSILSLDQERSQRRK